MIDFSSSVFMLLLLILHQIMLKTISKSVPMRYTTKQVADVCNH